MLHLDALNSPAAEIILSLSIMLLAGFLATRLTQKLRLPNVTGYILAGIAVGPYVLGLVPGSVIDGMDFVTDIALAFIAFGVGRYFKLEKLKETVAYAYERVPYYRQKLDEMGVAPSDIQTLEDVRKLPFTDKAVLRETFPFGLFAVPLDDIRELHSSSGTTGKPVVVGYTDDDMDMWSECIARLVQMAGVVPGDIAQMAFGYGMFTGGFGLHYGLQRLGCAMIPAGSGNTERHIQMIEDYGTTVLVATPSYAMHICEVGEKMGYDWAKSPLRVGLFGGEPCPPGLKAEIEDRMAQNQPKFDQ